VPMGKSLLHHHRPLRVCVNVHRSTGGEDAFALKSEGDEAAYLEMKLPIKVSFSDLSSSHREGDGGNRGSGSFG